MKKKILILMCLAVVMAFAMEKPRMVFKTEKLIKPYNYTGTATGKFATTEKQLAYYKALGYTDLFYQVGGFNSGKKHFLYDTTQNRIHYSGYIYASGQKGYYTQGLGEDIRGILLHAKKYGINVIPSIYNPISHSKELHQWMPEMSAIPQLKNFLYVKTNVHDRMNDSLILEIENKSDVPVRFYIGVDKDIVKKHKHLIAFGSNAEGKNGSDSSKVFELINTGYQKFQAKDSEGNLKLYDIYRSVKAYSKNEIIEIWNHKSIETDSGDAPVFHDMFTVFICPDAYDMYNSRPIILDTGDFELHAYSYDHANKQIVTDNLQSNGKYKVAKYNGDGDTLFTHVLGEKIEHDTVYVDPYHDITGVLGTLTYFQYVKDNKIAIMGGNKHLKPADYNPITKIAWDESTTNEDSLRWAKINNSIFEEYLKLLRVAYNGYDSFTGVKYYEWETTFPLDTAWPKEILIGYDELGVDGLPILEKAGYTAKDVAEDIAFRIKQIDRVFKNSNGTIKAVVWGDSFVPNDYGELYNLCGSGTDDKGVLHHLADINDVYGNSCINRIIVTPWRYNKKSTDILNGSTDIILDKMKQIKFLNELGVAYMPVLGEEWEIENKGGRKITEQCSYEWMNAAYNNSENLWGYAYTTWHHWGEFEKPDVPRKRDNDFTDFSYLAALVSFLNENGYLLKQYGSSGNNDGFISYERQLLSGIKWFKTPITTKIEEPDPRGYTLTRKDLAWQKGVHYRTGFALALLTENGLETQDAGNSHAEWDSTLSTFTVEGSASDLWATQESGQYAFTQRGDNFDFQVKVQDMVGAGKAGILIREHEHANANLIHLHYNDEDKNITVHVRDGSNNGNVYQLPNFITGADKANGIVLKVRRINMNIQLFASKSNGSNMTKLAEVPFSSDNVFVGMLSAKSDFGTVVFTDISLRTYADMTPINMLLLD